MIENILFFLRLRNAILK